ncbi:glutamate receptor 2.2-like protein [Cinnamomum micranthum f. kanehirae]|uniref:Glutamate receptor 2.2-like protein n=1 Tax=Cinnamomum micranthum f. kanehirae TaxID=337451 RepID=A0A443P0J0_9MAGN|nr:glutamate receptor 2.2-like protein [Cinnamomum micranthum f. kanehirae]
MYKPFTHTGTKEWAATVAAQKIDVGVILDQTSLFGIISNSTMTMALEDFYNGPGYNHQTRLVLHGRDSNKSITGSASARYLYHI